MSGPPDHGRGGFSPEDDDDHVPIVEEEAPPQDFLSGGGFGHASPPDHPLRNPSGMTRALPPQAPPPPPGAPAEPLSYSASGTPISVPAQRTYPSLSGPSGAYVPPSAPPDPPAPRAREAGPTSFEQIATGSVIDDKYQILVKLGQGGMGAVFRARHRLLEKDVALKVIASQVAQDANFKARFFREAKVAMDFVHRHAIPLRDFGQTSGGLFYMTMDYSGGSSLRSVVESEGPLEPARACRIVYQMLDALREAHRKKIVHRDLKPDNVMIEKDQDGRDFVKVLDFGLAKIAGGEEDGAKSPSLQSGEAILGTPAYMAPEQACGEDVDARADIYACGIVLYQLLTGELPFKALTTRQMILKQVASVPPPLKQAKPDLVLPDGLEAIVFKALAKERGDRFQTADDFALALEPFGEGSRRRSLSGDTMNTPAPGTILPVEVGVGATIDRYKILEKIAEGGFGAVYRAEHILMHRACAFKVMKAGLSMDEEFAARFQREAQIASKFKHPSAVEVYDFGKVGTQLFMAMELVEGKPLTKRIRTGEPPINLSDAVEIMLQVLEVLDAAHKAGIVHRDLKPDNIMLNVVNGWPNQVKVLDFGIAKMRDQKGEVRATQAGSFFGTPQYSSPEQCRGEANVDSRSDLYAMGVILFEMLTGNLPYESETAAGFLAAHMVTAPKRLRDVRPELKVPEPVEQVILKTLEKQRERRFQTAREFSDALRKASGVHPHFEVGESGIRVSQTSRLRAVVTEFKPQKKLGLAVMVILAIAIGLVFWFFGGPGSVGGPGAIRIRTSPGGVMVGLSSPTHPEAISVETTPDGTLPIEGLTPGEYSAVFMKAGFERVERTVVVEAGKTLELEVSLAPGSDEAIGPALAAARETAAAARQTALSAGAGTAVPDLVREGDAMAVEAEGLEKAGNPIGAKERWDAATDKFREAEKASKQSAGETREAIDLEKKTATARKEAEAAGGRELEEATMRRADEDARVGAAALAAQDLEQAIRRYREASTLYESARQAAAGKVDTRLDAEKKACDAARAAADAAGAEGRAATGYAAAVERRNDAIAAESRGEKLLAAWKYKEAAELFGAARGSADDRDAGAAFASRVKAQLAELEGEDKAEGQARKSAEAAGAAQGGAKDVFFEAVARSRIADQAGADARALLKDGAERIAPASRKGVQDALDFAVAKRRESKAKFAESESSGRRESERDKIRTVLEKIRAAAATAEGRYKAALEAARAKPGVRLEKAEAKGSEAAEQLALATTAAEAAIATGSRLDATRCEMSYQKSRSLFVEALELVRKAEASGGGDPAGAGGHKPAIEKVLGDWKKAFEAKSPADFGKCFGEWKGTRKEKWEENLRDDWEDYTIAVATEMGDVGDFEAVARAVVTFHGSRPPPEMRLKVTFRRFGGAGEWKIDTLLADK